MSLNPLAAARRWWAAQMRGVRVEICDVQGAAPAPGVLYVRRAARNASFGALQCPCGCGHVLQLRFDGDRQPRWRLRCDVFGRATVHPSIWRSGGCRSHFWLRKGRVDWV